MLGPFATASRLTPIHQVSLAVLSRAACASMSTTSTTRDRGDRYGPMEWAQQWLQLHLVDRWPDSITRQNLSEILGWRFFPYLIL